MSCDIYMIKREEKLFNKSNPDMKDLLLKDGYYELISLPKNKPQYKGFRGFDTEFIQVLLDDTKEDFKILHLYIHTASNNKKYKELSVEEAKNMLDKDHEVLKIIERLSLNVQLSNELPTQNKSDKVFKI